MCHQSEIDTGLDALLPPSATAVSEENCDAALRHCSAFRPPSEWLGDGRALRRTLDYVEELRAHLDAALSNLCEALQ